MNEDLAGHVESIFPDEPDDVPIFLSGEHGALLAELRQDLAAGRRFICVIGPAGSGKTRLMQALREDFERAHFEQSLIGLAAPSPKDPLLFALMKGMGLQVPDRDAPAARQRLSVILAMAEKKATPVLQIVDAAERLGPDELSTIFQLFGPSFTQVVLSGRPELLDLLADERRPLGVARPDVVHRLEGLAAADTDAYIRHRLWQARLPDDLFDTGASAAVHECSRGIPRSINAIARQALLSAEAAGEDRVDQAGVRAGGKDLGRAAATIPASRETPKATPEIAPPPEPARAKEGPRPVPSAAPVPPKEAAVRAPAPQPDKTKAPQAGQRPAAAIPLIERAQQRDVQRAPPSKPEPQREVPSASAKQVQHPAAQRGPQPTKQASRPAAAEAPTAAHAGRAQPSAQTPGQALPSASGGTSRQVGAAPGKSEPPPSAAQPPQRGIKPAAAAAVARDRSAAQSKRSAVRAPDTGTERRRRGSRTALLAMATIAALAIGVGAIIGIGVIREGSIVPGGTARWIADMTGQDRSPRPPDTQSLGASPDVGSGSDARPGGLGRAEDGAAPGATASTPPADETPVDLAALSPAQALTRQGAGSVNGGASAPGPREDSPAPTAGAAPTRQANDAQQAPEPPAAAAAAAQQTDSQGAQPKESRAADAAATPAPAPAPPSATAQDPAPPPPRTTAAAAPTPARQDAASAPRAPAQSAAAAKALVPSPGELARLYAVRAEYELKNGKPRDALVSVAYGLQADPEDNVLRELRARALQQLRVRAVQ